MSNYTLDDGITPGTNKPIKPTRCVSCGGDRFVLVNLRSPETTMWMEEHGIQASTQHFHEEYAPCPDCNNIDVSHFRHDGSRFRGMDPAQVRQAMRA